MCETTHIKLLYVVLIVRSKIEKILMKKSYFLLPEDTAIQQIYMHILKEYNG